MVIWNIAFEELRKKNFQGTLDRLLRYRELEGDKRDLREFIGLCRYQLGEEKEGISLMKKEAVTQGGDNQWTKRWIS